MMNRTLSIGFAVALSALLVGCAGAPRQNPMLENARTTYNAIQNDPHVARSGTVHLRKAQEKLEKAEMLVNEGAEMSLVEHVAYLANQHAEIARQQGLQAQLEEQIRSAQGQREQLNLQLKTSEADRARRAAQEAERATQAAEQELAALKAKKTERGMVLTLSDVLFDLDKAELNPGATRTVNQLADFMKEYENRRVRIEGYTDSTGDAGYNQQLSERRAMAVRDELVNRGVSRDRIEVKGYGETYPVATNETRAGRQLNRRVEIVVSDESGAVKSR